MVEDIHNMTTLTVGGQEFRASKMTLLKESDWLLAKSFTFAGGIGPTQSHEFDADPVIFDAILLALRTNTPFRRPKNRTSPEVIQQLQFWGLSRWCGSSLVLDSKLTQQDYYSQSRVSSMKAKSKLQEAIKLLPEILKLLLNRCEEGAMPAILRPAFGGKSKCDFAGFSLAEDHQFDNVLFLQDTTTTCTLKDHCGPPSQDFVIREMTMCQKQYGRWSSTSPSLWAKQFKKGPIDNLAADLRVIPPVEIPMPPAVLPGGLADWFVPTAQQSDFRPQLESGDVTSEEEEGEEEERISCEDGEAEEKEENEENPTTEELTEARRLLWPLLLLLSNRSTFDQLNFTLAYHGLYFRVHMVKLKLEADKGLHVYEWRDIYTKGKVIQVHKLVNPIKNSKKKNWSHQSYTLQPRFSAIDNTNLTPCDFFDSLSPV
jgi:hypothetical protein